MSGPARAGVLIYALNIERVSRFYEQILNASVVHADEEHRVLQSQDAQIVINAVPEPYRDSITIQSPPRPREEQAIKPFFTVGSLEFVAAAVEGLGGRLYGPVWPGPGMRVRNVCDPEGNIIHLREGAA